MCTEFNAATRTLQLRQAMQPGQSQPMQTTGFSWEANQKLWNKLQEDPRMNTTHTILRWRGEARITGTAPQQQAHRAAAYWIIKENQATAGFNFSTKKRNSERVRYGTGSLAYSGKYSGAVIQMPYLCNTWNFNRAKHNSVCTTLFLIRYHAMGSLLKFLFSRL